MLFNTWFIVNFNWNLHHDRSLTRCFSTLIKWLLIQFKNFHQNLITGLITASFYFRWNRIIIDVFCELFTLTANWPLCNSDRSSGVYPISFDAFWESLTVALNRTDKYLSLLIALNGHIAINTIELDLKSVGSIVSLFCTGQSKNLLFVKTLRHYWYTVQL